MKYAFIMNSRTLNPETYSVVYEHEGNQYYFAGVHGMKMTKELAKKLADDGYELLDLCGDYNEEKAQEVRDASEGKTKINYAKYSDEDLEKLDALQSTDQYGVIVLGFEPSEDLTRLELTSEEYNTYIAIAGSEEIAVRTAKEMVTEGINFIELCGYFTQDKAEVIAEAIDHKVPLGYCG